MVERTIKETVTEYDKDGNIVKQTVTETTEDDDTNTGRTTQHRSLPHAPRLHGGVLTI